VPIRSLGYQLDPRAVLDVRVFGLKPTYGRLPRTGTFPFVASLDHVGPFAASVDDLAAVYDVLRGLSPETLHARSARDNGGTAGFAASRPVLGGYFDEWATAAARVRCKLPRLRWVHDPRRARRRRALRAAAFVITGAEAGALRRARCATLRRREPRSRDRLVAGSLIPAAWLVQAQRVRRSVFEEALRCFEQHDHCWPPQLRCQHHCSAESRHQWARRAVSAQPQLLTQPCPAWACRSALSRCGPTQRMGCLSACN
jgi:Asp-tRNA(Asn)/Glu-tRNA(Gln) amidotransferase A subunit family amidase